MIEGVKERDDLVALDWEDVYKREKCWRISGVTTENINVTSITVLTSPDNFCLTCACVCVCVCVCVMGGKVGDVLTSVISPLPTDKMKLNIALEEPDWQSVF